MIPEYNVTTGIIMWSRFGKFAFTGLTIALLLLTLNVTLCQGDDALTLTSGSQAQVPAPAFPDGLEWLNVPAPLTLEMLRGKVVLLDFWTYGCINCIHMIPTLEQLEDLHGDNLVIISVHSAKFSNEAEMESLRQVIQRYDLRHPVVSDPDFAFWELYQVNAWPTFVIIDAAGNIAAMQAGEIPFEPFNRYITDLIAAARANNTLNGQAIEFVPEAASPLAAPLSFPSKVLADAAGNRLFIADTHHHRLVIADLTSYEVLEVIGAGGSGFDDGDYAIATFDRPQGMALVGETLYVADTDNHAIRAVDLLTRTVRTVAGTGVQSFGRDLFGEPLTTPLSSPWDLAFGDGVLFVAMAGHHQLWALLFERNTIGPVVGSGFEGLLDAPFADAQLAQPSGLAYHDRQLYFADSESSSIRAADLTTRQTRTLAGPLVNDLFTYGDVDGTVGESRLQHPLGVTLGAEGSVYVADTYNSRIKRIDPTTNTISTLAGHGSPGGFADGALAEAAFDEPGGLSYAGGRLYIADTNNHAIRVLDVNAGTVSTVVFPNPERLQIGERPTLAASLPSHDETLLLPPQTIAASASEIMLRITLPEGYKLNDVAPSTAEWNNAGEAIRIEEIARITHISGHEVRVPVQLSVGEDTLYAFLNLYYCREEAQSLCFIDRITLEIPVVIAATGAGEIIVERAIIP
jgi:thiol-disulfide isomerase/thioredoxin/sugar lactone lactonase YvrE